MLLSYIILQSMQIDKEEGKKEKLTEFFYNNLLTCMAEGIFFFPAWRLSPL